ncbi:MAG: dTDP-4-dehydrorhamnose reductase [Candidatus Sumerlaeaceae bacterium]
MAEIVVFGAGGMLGTDLILELNRRGAAVAGFTRMQCDITDRQQCARILSDEQPSVVINCAAYTNVNGAETETGAAFDTNARGAENVARACASIDARCIYLSTDYVFDGSKHEPYTEEDSPAPLNVYGKSKLEGERLTSAACRDAHCIVRTSWLYGKHGRNFVSTMLQLARKGSPVRVVNDQRGCPTSTLTLARALAQLIQSPATGIVHAACEGECTWYDFACEIFDMSGLRPVEIIPISTLDFPTPASRPSNSRLESRRLSSLGVDPLPDWRVALREYIGTLELERC